LKIFDSFLWGWGVGRVSGTGFSKLAEKNVEVITSAQWKIYRLRVVVFPVVGKLLLKSS
jgi:hypothetical protein